MPLWGRPRSEAHPVNPADNARTLQLFSIGSAIESTGITLLYPRAQQKNDTTTSKDIHG
jgi:hypothetical protein